MIQRPDNTDNELVRKNARMGLIVLAIVIGMTLLAFASVPLYDLFCRVTGFGGTTQTATDLPDNIIDREITIKFNADSNRDLPWDFKPEMREITIKLGQRGVTSYSAYNKAATPTTGMAVYNVTPLKVGKYFHKIQCFCFDNQTLKAGEKVDMPVLFYVDPQMNEDPNMEDVTTITLSYNFFKSESKALEDATEAFYNTDTK